MTTELLGKLMILDFHSVEKKMRLKMIKNEFIRIFLLVFISLGIVSEKGLAQELPNAASIVGGVSEPNVIVVSNEAKVAPNELSVKYINQFGGAISGVTMVGNLAYISQGMRLYIVDLLDPANPRIIGKTGILPDVGENIAIDGNYAYLGGRRGLSIIDISLSAEPYLVGFFPTLGEITNLDISSNYAFIAVAANLAANGGLHIIDVSDPTTPQEVGLYNPPEQGPPWGYTQEVAVIGDYAYVLFDFGLRVVDISNPGMPTEVGKLDSASGNGLVVKGNYAYISTFSGFRIVNISDPHNPTLTSQYIDNIVNYDLVVIGNYVFLASGPFGIGIFDITLPNSPNKVGTYVYDKMDYALGIAAFGNYVIVQENSRSVIVDVSAPLAPIQVDQYPEVQSDYRRLEIVGNRAYLLSGDGQYNNLQIMDVTSLAEPILLDINDGLECAGDLAVWKNYVYATHNCSIGPYPKRDLYIFEVTETGQLQQAGFLPISENPADIEKVIVSDNYAYVLDRQSLHILDLSNPVIPVEVGLFGGDEIENYAYTLAVAGTYAYIADDAGCIYIIDVSRPSSPVLTGRYQHVGFRLTQITVQGNALYAAGEGGISIIDVSNPAFPVEKAEWETPGWVSEVEVVGNYAYLAGQDGIYILDVTEPSSPTLVALRETEGAAINVEVAGGYTFVVGNGLSIFSDLTPVVSATIPLEGGELVSNFDSTTYTFPAGVFSDTTVVTHLLRFAETLPPMGELIGIKHFSESEAVNNRVQPVRPTAPFTMTVTYTEDEKGGVIEETLALYYWDGTQWVLEPGCALDAANNRIQCTIAHLAIWAVMGQTKRVFLPYVPAYDESLPGAGGVTK